MAATSPARKATLANKAPRMHPLRTAVFQFQTRRIRPVLEPFGIWPRVSHASLQTIHDSKTGTVQIQTRTKNR
jgi:hypothetical protein